MEVGAAPILIDKGWLLVYSHVQNYYDEHNRIFGVEALLLDREDPKRVLAKTEFPFLVPFYASISTLGPVRILRGFSFGIPSTPIVVAHQLPAAHLKSTLRAADYRPARDSGHSPHCTGALARERSVPRRAGASPSTAAQYNRGGGSDSPLGGRRQFNAQATLLIG